MFDLTLPRSTDKRVTARPTGQYIFFVQLEKLKAYLPGFKTGFANEMATGFNANIFVVFRADFAQLKCGSHLTVKLVLLLAHMDVLLIILGFFQRRICLSSVGIHITEKSFHMV